MARPRKLLPGSEREAAAAAANQNAPAAPEVKSRKPRRRVEAVESKALVPVAGGFGAATEDFEGMAREKLASSGLTMEDARMLGIEVVTREEVRDLGLAWASAVPAIRFTYYDPRTLKSAGGDSAIAGQRRPIMWGAGRQAQPIARYRWIGQTPPRSYDDKAPPKYVQPAGSPAHAYFPCIGDCVWSEVIEDVTIPLILTEGELKAAAATKEGWPTIGLGGVTSWKQGREATLFIPDLADWVQWKGRTVTLCFDSDVVTNPNVQRAVNGLAEQLVNQGAKVHVLMLEDVYEDPEHKTGLDDFLVERGREEFRGFLNERALPMMWWREMYAWNNKFVHVWENNTVFYRQTGQMFKVSDFASVFVSDHPKRVIGKDGEITYMPGKTAPQWLAWAHHTQVAKYEYIPGEHPHEVVERRGHLAFNLWPGWGVDPEPGNARPFFDLVDFLFEDDTEGKEYFLDWVAYPLQHPGVKLPVAAVLCGQGQGTGKTSIAVTLGRIYGENAHPVSEDELSDRAGFNYWAAERQFIHGDEITGGVKMDRVKFANAMKRLITQETVTINKKHIGQYVIKDCVNYLFTTNNIDAFILDEQDRRYFIREIERVETLPQSFYDEYYDWLNNQNGAAHVFHELLHRDLSKFNPYGKAPMTSGKRAMMEATFNDVQSWVIALREDPDGMLRYGDVPLEFDLYTADQLTELYNSQVPVDSMRVRRGVMMRELRKAQCFIIKASSINTAATVWGVPGLMTVRSRSTVYAVRNIAFWRQATNVEILDHLDPNRPRPGIPGRVHPVRREPINTRLNNMEAAMEAALDRKSSDGVDAEQPPGARKRPPRKEGKKY